MSVTVTLNCAFRTIVSNRDNNGERRGYLGLVETRDRLEFCRGNKRLWCADAVDSLLYIVTLGRDGNVANFRYLLYSTSELRSSTHSRFVSLCHWVVLQVSRHSWIWLHRFHTTRASLVPSESGWYTTHNGTAHLCRSPTSSRIARERRH